MVERVCFDFLVLEFGLSFCVFKAQFVVDTSGICFPPLGQKTRKEEN
jgi:hypothetical protein